MKVIIDRFEGNYAVVEISRGHMINVPKELFPSAHEGDMISINIDHKETKDRKEKISSLMNDVFKD